MKERFGSGWKMCDIMILLFDGFWKRNLGSTSVWRRMGRGKMREEREFAWIHDLVRNIFVFLFCSDQNLHQKKIYTSD